MKFHSFPIPASIVNAKLNIPFINKNHSSCARGLFKLNQEKVETSPVIVTVSCAYSMKQDRCFLLSLHNSE